jgi:CBS domain-containing protein
LPRSANEAKFPMRASDIMTTPAITVGPDTSAREIAQLLFERRISAVPVVEEERLVGLVSEADLLHRPEIGTDRIAPHGPWWLRLFSEDRSAAEYVKSHAGRARDIMTRDVVTVTPETPVAEIASLLETRGIKRVPVVREGRLAGIVSRSNLVQALAVKAPPEAARPEDDHAIRAALLAELERQPWWRRRVAANVIVTDGIVHLWGTLESEDERQAARVAAENIPGVRGIEDHRFRTSALPAAP